MVIVTRLPIAGVEGFWGYLASNFSNFKEQDPIKMLKEISSTPRTSKTMAQTHRWQYMHYAWRTRPKLAINCLHSERAARKSNPFECQTSEREIFVLP